MTLRIKSLADLGPAIRELNAAATGQFASTVPYPAGAIVADLSRPASKPIQKFRNVETVFNGITFKSKWEAQRYGELLRMQERDLIVDLAAHLPFGLHVRSPSGELIRIGCYEADSVYYLMDKTAPEWRGRMVVEDAKSAITRRHPLYVWKRSHFEMEYGVRITEVERTKPRTGVTE